MAKEILKEAIADAKAVREVALENAKMALEEAFDSKIKSMLSAKLAEELEEDVELEEEYIEEEAEATDEGMSYMRDEDEKEEDMKEGSYMEDEKEEDMKEEFELEEDEEINLDELMAELEQMEGMDYSEDEKEEDMKEGEDQLEEEAEPVDENVKDAMDAIKKAAKAAGKTVVDYLVGNKFIDSGISGGRTVREDEDDTNEAFDIDALVAEIESEIEEGKKKKKDDDKDDKVEEAYGDSPGKGTGPAKGKPGAPFGDGKSGKGSTGYDGAVKQLKEERDEALAAVSTLQETISEMNLLNSKLLYCNKLFRANALNEAQKVKVVDALDKATTTGEAKLVFETLQESFNFIGVEKRAIKEGLARASKPVGTAPKKVLSESVDETVSRFQKLANINK